MRDREPTPQKSNASTIWSDGQKMFFEMPSARAISRAAVRAMSALTIRLPEDKCERLRELSRRRGVSLNRLIDEMITVMLAEFDAEVRFALRVQRGLGQDQRGLALLKRAAGRSR